MMRHMDATRFRFVNYLTHVACLMSYKKWVPREKYPNSTCLHYEHMCLMQLSSIGE